MKKYLKDEVPAGHQAPLRHQPPSSQATTVNGMTKNQKSVESWE